MENVTVIRGCPPSHAGLVCPKKGRGITIRISRHRTSSPTERRSRQKRRPERGKLRDEARVGNGADVFDQMNIHVLRSAANGRSSGEGGNERFDGVFSAVMLCQRLDFIKIRVCRSGVLAADEKRDTARHAKQVDLVADIDIKRLLDAVPIQHDAR